MAFENKLVHLEEATNEVISLETAHKDMNDSTKKSSLSRKSWTNPNPGALKLNVDGAIFSKQHSVGIWCVLRDD